MRLKFFGKTDIGRRRKMNQDSMVMDGKNSLFIVADGMGGHKGGEVASRLACDTLRTFVSENHAEYNPSELLIKGFQEATRMVHLEANKPAQGSKSLKGMGTTLVCIYIKEGRVYIANVGDSRAYLYTEGELWVATEDHSLVNEKLRAGIITDEQAEHVGKNVITRCIGFQPEVEVDIFDRKLMAGEAYMLCSDGLHGMIDEDWMLSRYKNGKLDTYVDELINEANTKGGEDNITCLFIHVES